MAGEPQKSTGELVRDALDDLTLLVRKELELARRELTEGLMLKLKGAGLVALAVALLLPALVFFLVALALWLPVGAPAGFAAVGGGMLLVAGGGTYAGIRLVRSPRGPKAAVESIKEDVRWARERLTR